MGESPALSHYAEVQKTDWEVVSRLFQSVSDRRPLHEALQSIACEALNLVSASTVAIAIRELPGSGIKVQCAAGQDAEVLRGMAVRGADSPAHSVLRTGQPVFAKLGSDTDVLPDFGRLGTRAWGILPIVGHSSVVGVLLVLGQEGAREFSDADRGALQGICAAAALAFQAGAGRQELSEAGGALDALYESVAAVSSSLSLPHVLDSVVEALCRHIPNQCAALFLYNDEKTHLFVAAERNLPDETREAQLTSLSPLVVHCQEVLHPVRIHGSNLSQIEDLPGLNHIRSAIAAPICFRDEPLGLFLLASAAPDGFTKGDLRLTEAVVNQTGIALQNALLHESTSRRSAEATALYDLTQRLGMAIDQATITQVAVDVAAQLIVADRVALLMYQSATGMLCPVGSRNLSQIQLDQLTLGRGQGIPGWVLEWSTPTFVTDIAADARNRSGPMEGMGAASCLAVPMTAGEETSGVLIAFSTRRRLFTIEEMELLYTVANTAATALEKVRLLEEARTAAASLRRYFSRMAVALGNAMDEGAAPQLFCDLALAMLRADRCLVVKLMGSQAEVRGQAGFTRPPIQSWPVEGSLTASVVRRGRSLAVDVSGEEFGEQYWLNRETMESYVGIPIKSVTGTVGVVEIAFVERRTLEPGELRLMTQFIQKSRLAEHLLAE